jgi:hypothetical protein
MASREGVKLSMDGSLEATRRHIATQWPGGATEPLTFEAAVLAHAWDRTHPGYGPKAAATLLMDRHKGDYQAIREHYDNFTATGVLWAGAVV